MKLEGGIVTHWLKRLWKGRGTTSGNAMLEFAVGAGVLVSAFAGAFQYGYLFYRYNTIENAVNAGARYASLRPYDSTTTTPTTGFSNAVKNIVVYGKPDGGTSPVAPGLTTSNVQLTVTFTNGLPSAMSVAITGYTLDLVFASQNLSGKPKVTYPYLGIYSPY